MDQPSYSRLTNLLPLRRRPSLFSRKKHELREQFKRNMDNLHSESISASTDSCARDPNVRSQRDDHYLGKSAISTSGHRRSKSLHGWDKSGEEGSAESVPSPWRPSTSLTSKRNPATTPTACGWLRRCMSTTLGRRHRPEHISTITPEDSSLRDIAVTLLVPGIGIEPPQVPDSTTSGAAARAAAAAQNEIHENVRNMRLAEPTVTRDSESGIGIEVRERGGENADSTIPVVRRGV